MLRSNNVTHAVQISTLLYRKLEVKKVEKKTRIRRIELILDLLYRDPRRATYHNYLGCDNVTKRIGDDYSVSPLSWFCIIYIRFVHCQIVVRAVKPEA